MTKDKNVFESSVSFNQYQKIGPKGEDGEIEANKSQNHSVHSDVDESFKEL